MTQPEDISGIIVTSASWRGYSIEQAFAPAPIAVSVVVHAHGAPCPQVERMTREFSERAAREHQAYDNPNSFKYHNRHFHKRFSHLRASPAAQRARRRFRDLVLEHAQAAPALEIGCGAGDESAYLRAQGACHIDAVDVSKDMIARAEAQHGGDPRLRFHRHDIHHGWHGRFRVIFGRAVLHHLDFASLLPRLYHDNLAAGGVMAFIEPLGSNPLMQLYWRLTPQLHSPDERPFLRRDLRSIAAQLGSLELTGIDLFQVPATLLSSYVLEKPNNRLTRWADRLDAWLLRVCRRRGIIAEVG